jgi:DNA-binding MarR family transcriptional regulator
MKNVSHEAQKIGAALLELRAQMAVLNHRVGAKADLKDVDLDCLELLNRHGSQSPSTLARRTGLHPATMTGILDRLERAGWVTRDRDPADRRAVVVRVLPERTAEVGLLYARVDEPMRELCASFSTRDLAVVEDFLTRAATTIAHAANDLA